MAIIHWGSHQYLMYCLLITDHFSTSPSESQRLLTFLSSGCMLLLSYSMEITPLKDSMVSTLSQTKKKVGFVLPWEHLGLDENAC